MKPAKLGTITIGQAPRADATPFFDEALDPRTPRRHVGLLARMDRAEIGERFAPRPGAPVLACRLLDGATAVLDKARIAAALQAEVDTLEEEGCTKIVPLCDTEFARLRCRRGGWLAAPRLAVASCVAALAADRWRVGMLVPRPERIAASEGWWDLLSNPPIAEVACPYAVGEDGVAEAATALRERGAQILVADGTGFVERHRRAASEASGLRVVLSNAAIARLLASTM